MNCICCKKWGRCPAMDEKSALHSLGLNGYECDYEHPIFITPTQFKRRTGREYPKNAPVWFRLLSAYDWELLTFQRSFNFQSPYMQTVCAFGDLVPPDDWRPETGGNNG